MITGCQLVENVTAVVLGVIVCGIAGCGRGAATNDEPTDAGLNWKQAEAALKSPDVHTANELFTRLSKEPLPTREKDSLADLKRQEALSLTFEKYFADRYLQPALIEDGKAHGLDMSTAAIRTRLAGEINWKVAGASLDNVSRVYVLSTMQESTADRLATGDKPIYFPIFTDDKGTILGWKKN